MSIHRRPLRSLGLGLLVVATLATAAVRATRPERDHWFPAASAPAAAPAAHPVLAAVPAPATARGDPVLDFIDQLHAVRS